MTQITMSFSVGTWKCPVQRALCWKKAGSSSSVGFPSLVWIRGRGDIQARSLVAPELCCIAMSQTDPSCSQFWVHSRKGSLAISKQGTSQGTLLPAQVITLFIDVLMPIHEGKSKSSVPTGRDDICFA